MSIGHEARDGVELAPKDLLRLAAEDGDFFARTFFPGAFRQPSAAFHHEIWSLLFDPAYRWIAMKMFRGSAKTTLLRVATLHRICFGLSRTILYLSASQGHALKSTMWLKNQIETNRPLCGLFGLKRGQRKWTEEWLEIEHATLGHTANIVAAGITGQTRGLNIADYRPDLIVCDDVLDEENTGTKDQITKINDRFFGSIEKSLSPSSEAPHAKLVLLQTPFVEHDLIDICCKDPRWQHREFGCFDADGDSRWPTRYPTDLLMEDKRSYVARGQTLLWMREMEVRIVGDELADFKRDWIKFWHMLPVDAQFPTFLAIDPVPPRDVERRTRDGDFEVLAVVGLLGSRVYVLEVSASRGHDPDWTMAEFFRLAARWRPVRVRVEGVNYQRTLKFMLEGEMRRRRLWYAIEAPDDKRKKRHRIVQSLAPTASRGDLYLHPTQLELIRQFTLYPHVEHDDELDAVAMATELALAYGEFEIANDDDPLGGEPLEPLKVNFRSAP